MIRRASDIFIVVNIDFSKLFLFLGLILLPEYKIPSYLLWLIDDLDILFCTNKYKDKVKTDRLFIQGYVKWYSERNWRCPIKKNEDFCG